MIKVVHFSTTPMAGGPMRMIRALNAYTNVSGRLIELERNHSYDSDLILSESLDECMEVVNGADVINFHNYLNLESADFHPINFKELEKQGKAFIIYYRSDPFYISGVTRKSVNDILNNPMPAIVNGQYPERYFEKARVVRNVMPDFSVPENLDMIYDIVNISSKSQISAKQSRWGTKGYPEYLKVIKRSGLDNEFKIKNGAGLTYKETMNLKAAGKIVLDDLVTGSYHMAGIEGLMLGKPTMVFLDSRIEHVLKTITGSEKIPFVNAHLSEFPKVAREILSLDNSALKDIGDQSHLWFDKYWDQRDIAKEYAGVYEELLENPQLVTRQKTLSKDYLGKSFSIEGLDLIHQKLTHSLPITWEATYFALKKLIKKLIRRK